MDAELQPNKVAIRIPALFTRKINGDINGAEVLFEIKVTFPDGKVVEHREPIMGKASSPYERHIEILHPSLREGTSRA